MVFCDGDFFGGDFDYEAAEALIGEKNIGAGAEEEIGDLFVIGGLEKLGKFPEVLEFVEIIG